MTKKCVLILISILILISASPAFALKTLRVGYFEPGQYYMTKVMMSEIHEILEQESGDSVSFLFEPYAYKSAEWRRNLCRAMAGDLARMNNIDMVIAAGPWVVEDLLDAGFSKPIIAIYRFDPVVEGLLDRTLKPIAPNLTVNYDPGRLERDMAVIDRYFPELNIGFVYFPSNDELPNMIEKFSNIAERYGHKIFTGEHYNNEGLYSYFAARKQVADSSGVIYAPPLWGLEIDRISQFISEAHFGRIPVFTYDGYLILEKGAYLSGTNYPYRSLAALTVDKMIKIANGAKPSDLPVIFEDITTICLNLNEASKMGHAYSDYDLLGVKTIPAIEENPDALYDIDFAVRQALVENPDILAIDQTYQKAMHEAGKAKAAYYPKFDLRAGASSADNDRRASLYNRLLNREYFADITANQTVFSYSALKTIQAAKKNLAIKETGLEKARHDLQLTVVLAYFETLKAQERLDLSRERLEHLRRLHESASTRFRLNHGDSLDIALLSNRLSEAQIETLEAKLDLFSSRTLLNILTNRPADYNFVLDSEALTPEIMAQMVLRLEELVRDSRQKQRLENYLVNLGAENSHTLKMAELSMRRQNDLISANKGILIPEISLRARYSYSEEFDPALDEKRHDWTIGGILTWPILNGWKRNYGSKALRAEMETMAYRKDASRLQLTREISTTAERLFTLMLTLPQNYRVRNDGRANFDALIDRYRNNKLPIHSLLYLFDEQYGREYKLINDRFAFFDTYAELLHTIGKPFMPYGSEADRNFYARLLIEMTK